MTTKAKKPAPARKPQRSRSSAQTAKPVRRADGGDVRKARPARPASRSRKEVRPVKPTRRVRRSRAESQVVYTPPKPFNKLRFLLGIATAAAIVLALTLGMSIFFKVEHIMVAGTQKYTAWDIREASGIREGDNLMTLGKARVGGKIIAQLPYVDHVRIGIKLPDTVNIEITELEVIYTAQAMDNTWWFINSQGRVLEQTTGVTADNYTQIRGVWIQDPVPGQQAVAALPEGETETIPTEATTPEGETETIPTAPVDMSNAAEQFSTALLIIQNLEDNGIIGDVTYVDVSNLYNLMILYDDRYEVMLGDSTQMAHKIRSMKQAAQQMSEYQQGMLDVSFTTWPDKVGYTPFEN